MRGGHGALLPVWARIHADGHASAAGDDQRGTRERFDIPVVMRPLALTGGGA